MTIQVQADGRVLVNFIQYGIQYHSIALANREAQKLHDKYYPSAKLILCLSHYSMLNNK